MGTARTPIDPGEILKDELDELGMSAAPLGRQIKAPPNWVCQILSGRRAITADTALRLARLFGAASALWTNLQQTYEPDLARKPLGEAIGRLLTRGKIAVADPSEELKDASSDREGRINNERPGELVLTSLFVWLRDPSLRPRCIRAIVALIGTFAAKTSPSAEREAPPARRGEAGSRPCYLSEIGREYSA